MKNEKKMETFCENFYFIFSTYLSIKIFIYLTYSYQRIYPSIYLLIYIYSSVCLSSPSTRTARVSLVS